MRKESKVLSAVIASFFLMFIVFSAAINPALSTEKSDMLKYGEKLWKDTSLSTIDVSCATCHPDGSGLYSEAYPKYIDMAKKDLTLEGIINFCMEKPMKSKALSSDSKQMRGLKAYVLANSKATRSAAAQPCGMNPCSMKNPCGKNPCMKNPCAMKNPCGKNPCMKNPCTAKNPCGENPCSYNPCGMNPCSMKNPCAKNPCDKNPCTMKNPCGKNPCGVNPCAMKNPCGK